MRVASLCASSLSQSAWSSRGRSPFPSYLTGLDGDGADRAFEVGRVRRQIDLAQVRLHAIAAAAPDMQHVGNKLVQERREGDAGLCRKCVAQRDRAVRRELQQQFFRERSEGRVVVPLPCPCFGIAGLAADGDDRDMGFQECGGIFAIGRNGRRRSQRERGRRRRGAHGSILSSGLT